MNRGEIEAYIMKELKEMAERDDLMPGTELLGEDGISSIELMMLVSSVEERFRIHILPRELRKIGTAADLAAVIDEKTKQS